MILPDTKLFVQLQPDQSGVAMLQIFQSHIAGFPDARMIDAKALHLTVIHIGKAQRIIDSLQKYSSDSSETILKKLDQLASDLLSVAADFHDNNFTLQPVSFANFGETHGALVVRFDASCELTNLHGKSLDHLEEFIRECGIENAVEFMARDANLCHALTLTPHVTIAKSHNSIDHHETTLDPVNFTIMPIIYHPS